MSQRKNKLIGAWILALVICMPLSFAQVKTQLTLELNVPDYVNERHIDVTGRTEQNAVVELWLNGKLVRKTTFPDGDIIFYDVALEPNTANIIVVKSFALGLSAEKQVTVVCDLVKPVLTLTELPLVTKKQKVTVSGNVSESADIEIFLGGNSVFKAENVQSFSKEVVLEEGENTLLITAVDKAGNKEEVSHTVVKDTKPPKIENLYPESGAFYYEGKAIDDVKGKTEPFADVKLYVIVTEDGKEKRELVAETKADADGYFKFEDVNFENPKKGISFSIWELGLGAGVEAGIEEVAPGEETEEWYEQKVISVRFVVVAEDAVKHKTEKQFTIGIGTCWSGAFKFDIDVLPEYVLPTLLSPERLSEGTERISFVMNVSYVGGKPKGDWQIVDVRIDHACGRSLAQLAKEYEDDPRYGVACEMLKRVPHPHKDSNRDKTLWYVEFKNLYSKEFEELVNLKWDELKKKLRFNQLIFPLRVTIAYREKEEKVVDGKLRKVFGPVKYQTKCISVAYFVDFPVDPRDVWPDWLINDGIKFANRTVSAINKVMPYVDKTVMGVGAACIGSMLGRFAVKVIRKAVCAWESWAGRVMPSEERQCPIAAKRMKLDDNGLKEKCPLCANWWDIESKLYVPYRLTCDRIFCHRVPAGWTAFPTPASEIAMAKASQLFCGLEEKLGITPLRKLKWSAVEEEMKGRLTSFEFPRGQEPEYVYEYKFAYYAPDPNKENKLVKITQRSDVITNAPKTLPVEKIGDTYGTAIDKECDEMCKDFFGKDFKGRCGEEKSCAKAGNYPIGYSKDCLPKQKICCCELPEKERAKKEKEEEKLCRGKSWNYRMQQLYRETKGKFGCKYPDDRYYRGRDIYACAGMDHLFDYLGLHATKAPILDPKDHVVAFQCACLTGIRARLILLRNIMTGLMNCLEQVKTTGKANAGVCKELFAMYFCDLLYQVFVAFEKGCITLPFGVKARVLPGVGKVEYNVEGEFAELGAALRFGTKSLFESILELGKDLEAEYGETVFSNLLTGGSREISRKICLAALGFDVGFDMRNLLDVGYTTQFKTTAEAFSARRDFLTYNPATGIPTYEYRASWVIFPGCDIESYTVDLVCVNMEEKAKYRGIDCSSVNDLQHGEATRGCNCLYSTEPYSGRSRRFYVSKGPIKAGSFVEEATHAVIEDPKRYDHIRIKIHLKPGFSPDKCFPEGHKDGVFFFPIVDKTARDLLDCFVDQKGIMKCTRGIEWEQRGDAYFMPFSEGECKSGKKCYFLCRKGNEWKDCDIVKYSVAEPINVKVRVAQKRDQCLFAKFTTHTGKEKLVKFYKIQTQLTTDEYFTRDAVVNLGIASAADFPQIEYGFEKICKNMSLERKEQLDKENYEEKGSFTLGKSNDMFSVNISAGQLLLNGNLTSKRTFTESEFKNVIWRVGGFAFKPKLNLNAFSGKCNVSVARTKKEYPFNLKLELRYLDSDMQCDADAEEVIYSPLGLTELQQSVTIQR